MVGPSSPGLAGQRHAFGPDPRSGVDSSWAAATERERTRLAGSAELATVCGNHHRFLTRETTSTDLDGGPLHGSTPNNREDLGLFPAFALELGASPPLPGGIASHLHEANLPGAGGKLAEATDERLPRVAPGRRYAPSDEIGHREVHQRLAH